MKRYLLFWLGMTMAVVLAVAAINVVVDPHGLFRVVDRPGFNSYKPKAASYSKAYQVLRVQPRGLILGSSRSEVGFDPEHPAWPATARPVFNLGLPGTGTSVTLRYLRHVLANDATGNPRKPELVVWGLDFMDYLVDPRLAGGPAQQRREDSRLLGSADGADETRRWLQRARDYTESTLTLGALLDSIQTVGNQTNPYVADLSPLGFNPMRNYLKISADEGYWAVFRQKDIANLRSALQRPKGVFDSGGRSSPALDDLREVMALCRQHGIALHLVIYPYHAHLLEIIRIAGQWEAFEAWKRAVAQIVADSATDGRPAVPLWDFSGFDPYSMEPIPDQGDRRTTMRWYWEAGHFKNELGGMVLDRVFGRTAPVPGFGVALDRTNLEQQIATVRAQEADYRQSHPGEVAALQRIALDLVSRQQKNQKTIDGKPEPTLATP